MPKTLVKYIGIANKEASDMVKAVLFDFDGTLADTAPVIVACFHESFKAFGLPDRTDAEIRSTIGLPLFDSFLKLQPSLSKERAKTIVAHYRDSYQDWALRVLKPYPGTEDILKGLKAQGYALAVVSSKMTYLIEKMVQALGFAKYFDLLVGEELVAHKKPAPDMDLYAMEKLHADPKQTTMVGDSTYDIGMGNAAGIRTIWASYGYGTKEAVLSQHPTQVIQAITDLKAIYHLN